MLPAWWGHKLYPIDRHKEAWFPCVCVCVIAGACIYFFWGIWIFTSFFFILFFFCLVWYRFGAGCKTVHPGPGTHDRMGHETSLVHSGRVSVGHALGG